MRLYKLFTITLVSSHLCFAFNLNDISKIATDAMSSESTPTTSSQSTSTSYIESGLKEALTKGVQSAIESLGKENGYFNNSEVKIPLPDSLIGAETLMRKAGAGTYADDLIKAMNNAASAAAPKTATVLTDTIKQMSIEDANKILASNNTAATQYFKDNAYDKLKNIIAPIIKESIGNNQVASYYEAFNTAYKQYGKDLVENSSVMSYAKNFGVDQYIPSADTKNLEEYITSKALDGLFTMIEKEEIAIRTNPVSRTTNLLKDVFK